MYLVEIGKAAIATRYVERSEGTSLYFVVRQGCCEFGRDLDPVQHPLGGICQRVLRGRSQTWVDRKIRVAKGWVDVFQQPANGIGDRDRIRPEGGGRRRARTRKSGARDRIAIGEGGRSEFRAGEDVGGVDKLVDVISRSGNAGRAGERSWHC